MVALVPRYYTGNSVFVVVENYKLRQNDASPSKQKPAVETASRVEASGYIPSEHRKRGSGGYNQM